MHAEDACAAAVIAARLCAECVLRPCPLLLLRLLSCHDSASAAPRDGFVTRRQTQRQQHNNTNTRGTKAGANGFALLASHGLVGIVA